MNNSHLIVFHLKKTQPEYDLLNCPIFLWCVFFLLYQTWLSNYRYFWILLTYLLVITMLMICVFMQSFNFHLIGKPFLTDNVHFDSCREVDLICMWEIQWPSNQEHDCVFLLSLIRQILSKHSQAETMTLKLWDK